MTQRASHARSMPIFLASGVSSQKLIELEAWGALPAMSVDWVRDHIMPERTFSFSGVITTMQVGSDSCR
nr:hypothetical protein FA04_08900 [Ensifer adhaerens]